MLKIGVSACFMYPEPDRKVFGPKTLSYIENDMARYLSVQGVIPVLIPDLTNEFLEELVDELDGFVFQGGTDLSPQSYGQVPIENGRWLGDAERDRYELKLMDMVVKTGKPILGICRGMQLMNVYFGGTLYQDTKTQRPEVNNHRDAAAYDRLFHDVRLVQGKLLAEIYSADRIAVNSVHHQSVKDLGEGLEVLALSDDEVIEAIGHNNSDDTLILGVQWHPEFSHTLGGQVADPQLLYSYFLNKVKEAK